MITEIKLPKNTPFFQQRIALDGKQYQLELRWNEREQHWYYILGDSAGVRIVGRKLATGSPMLRGVTGLARPLGELVPVDTLATGAPATLTDLGERVKLYYIDAAERVTLRGKPHFRVKPVPAAE